MGNHQQHEEIQRQINSLEVVHKYSYGSILRNNHGDEFIKFLYVPSIHSQQSQQIKDTRTNSIFNKNYLQFRLESQQSNKMDMLPKLIAFGEQTQNAGIISCTETQLNFVIFQHPAKTLKQEVQNRISSGTPFQQRDMLNLIRSVCEALSQYFQHIKSWNEEILEKKTFAITEENIYLAYNGKFIISDILSNFNQIQQISKQQVILRKSSKTSSSTNLHAKMTSKKIKLKFYQTNFANLASIIQSIIFKFQCFAQPNKSSQQSQSLSTALQSYRGINKNSPHYSNEFQKVLKELRQTFVDENNVIEHVDRILNPVHLPTPFQSCEDISILMKQKKSLSKTTDVPPFQQLKLNGINNFNISQEREPLTQIFNQNTYLSQKSGQITHNLQKSIESRRPSHYFSQKGYLSTDEPKILQRNNTKLRLSLKKDSQIEKQIQSRQNSVENNKILQRKTSHPKFLCSKNHENQQKGKQNLNISIKINPIQFPLAQRRRSQTMNFEKLSEKFINIKLEDKPLKLQQTCLYDKKKVFLKKPNKEELNAVQKPLKKYKNETSDSSIHLNPMSKKKTLGLNKFLNCKSKQTLPIFKTIEKTNQIDMDFIENLSSIMSNQNNTLSSVGIPMTDEFKTDNSMIQEQGCIGFNDIVDSPNQFGNGKLASNSQMDQFSKKYSNLNRSPNLPYVKLSSYSSLQLVESIIEKAEDKIPEFLKKFKLPEKHLLALNNIILTQKDIIVEESFQQSDFNSIRQSVPNILCLDDETFDPRKKRNSNAILVKLDQMTKKDSQTGIVCELINQQDIFGINSQKQSVYFQKQGDSVERALKFIEVSLINSIDQ